MAIREREVYFAKLAEQAEQYEDMTYHMGTVVRLPGELSIEERNLLSVAYKNAVGSRRAAWRFTAAIEQKESGKGSEHRALCAKEFRMKIEAELQNLCNGILSMLDCDLLPQATTSDSKVFYLKMKADYHRYIAEFSCGEAKSRAAELAEESYETAEDVAETELPATDPIRLALALNHSVFLYEISDKVDEACSLAHIAFEAAMEGLDNVPEDVCKDSTLIMQLLRDNLMLWTHEREVEQAEP